MSTRTPRILVLAAAASTTLVAPGLHAREAQPGPVLKPSSPWHLDAANEKCRLAREFGDGTTKHVLLMELDEPSTTADFLVAGPAIRETKWRKPAGFRFGTLEPVYEERYSKGSFGDYEPALMTVETSLSAPDQRGKDIEYNWNVENASGLASIPTERFVGHEMLSVVQDDTTIVTLQLPNLVPALRALNQCAENLVEFWGLDLEQHRTMQRGPEWTNSKVVIRRFMSDYPSKALRRGEQGSVRFVVLVDEKGEIIECRQSDATELEALDSPACRAMERAKFEPALDANGQPMRSYYATKIRYVLP
ncbi:energy transducer TonB [Qipengyuania sp. 1NDH17]|uniref:Energy transducer TonB n=1 Tax=Qipengyuania polymorpha TaxID=2867234 RepID=A0ABS7IZ16_9SPHN|nr:energy transducer TonB [Qipengyuania polymorpha]MBX7458809.1 energy transducer TonB [Qipengyuania polymorpha]